MTDVDHREKARLRSERWRRAHGIMPRRPAQRPWLAEGCSRSTWYRRRKQAREREAVAMATAASHAALKRLSFQLSLLRSDLERCAAIYVVIARELNEPWTRVTGP